MVRPEDNDGVCRVRTGVQRIEEQADHRIGVGDRGQVALHALTPLIGRQDVLVVVPAPVSDLDPPFGDVLEVVCDELRELNRIERKHLEVLPGDVPGKVGAVNADGQKERLLVLPL